MTSRCSKIWPCLLLPPRSHSPVLRVPAALVPPTQLSRRCFTTCSFCWDPFPPGCCRACSLVSFRGLLKCHVPKERGLLRSVCCHPLTLCCALLSYLPHSCLTYFIVTCFLVYCFSLPLDCKPCVGWDFDHLVLFFLA